MDDRNDFIQRYHVRGEFYEARVLEYISKFIPPQAIYCDVGANVGNHVIYVGKYLNPKKIIPFEPNPRARMLLTANISANGLDDVTDLANVSLGFSDQAADGLFVEAPARNLGAGRLVSVGAAGIAAKGVAVRRGDDLLADVCPDFIKIDVEGMETDALRGLQATIARARPVIFVETTEDTLADVQKILADHEYTIMQDFVFYRKNHNLLAVPAERCREGAAAVKGGRSFAYVGSKRVETRTLVPDKDRRARSTLLFRTHHWNKTVEENFEYWRAANHGNALLVYHDREGDFARLPAQYDALRLDEAWVRENGLPLVRKWGWRLGDYVLYRALSENLSTEYFFSVDADISLTWDDPGNFFEECAALDHDLLSAGMEYSPGPRRLRQLKSGVYAHLPQKRSCNFGLIRVSRRLAEIAFRQRQLGRWDEVVPTDEGHISTLCANLPNFRHASFSQALPWGARLDFRHTDRGQSKDRSYMIDTPRTIVAPIS